MLAVGTACYDELIIYSLRSDFYYFALFLSTLVGIDTATNEVGLARCIDDNDNYETSFREGMVPGDRNVWCLDSDPTRCIRNTFPTGSGLTVMIREGNQDELWNYDTNREIQPRATDLTCVVRDRPEASTVVKVERCSLVGFEYRS